MCCTSLSAKNDARKSHQTLWFAHNSQIVVGLGNGSVQYYDGTDWYTLTPPEECTSSKSKKTSCSNYNVNAIEAQFFTGNLRIVYANNIGDVYSYTDGKWNQIGQSSGQSPNDACLISQIIVIMLMRSCSCGLSSSSSVKT